MFAAERAHAPLLCVIENMSARQPRAGSAAPAATRRPPRLTLGLVFFNKMIAVRALPLRRALAVSVRTFSSLPAAVEPATKEVAAPAPPAAAPAAAAPAPASKAAGSVWQRFTAFLTGVGVASLWYYNTISADVLESSAHVEAGLKTLESDVAASNQELRAKLAVLEHKVAELDRRV